jgi:hypothetical protein
MRRPVGWDRGRDRDRDPGSLTRHDWGSEGDAAEQLTRTRRRLYGIRPAHTDTLTDRK